MNVEECLNEFFTAGAAAANSSDRNELHTLRIAAKKLRYTLELLDPKGAAPLLKKLRTVQGELGDMNDAFVAREYLLALPSLSARARPIPAKLQTLGEQHIDRFHAAWPRLFPEKTQRKWSLWAAESKI